MLETIYSCGLRAQEPANLNWRDIDFRAGFIRVNNGKGGKDRIVPIGEKSLVALWDYGKAYHKRFEKEPAGLNPVFPSRRRQRITTRNIQRIIALRLKLAGIDTKMSTHGLRHSFATHCMQNWYEDQRARRMPWACKPQHDAKIYAYHAKGSDR